MKSAPPRWGHLTRAEHIVTPRLRVALTGRAATEQYGNGR